MGNRTESVRFDSAAPEKSGPGARGRGFKLRKLGMIGGMSWSSTALYYEHINRAVAQRLGGLHSAPLGIESLDFDQIATMQAAGDWNGIAKVVRAAAKRLEAGGAQGLIIACTTVHKCYDSVS